MVTVTGKSEVRAFMAALPGKLERDVLRGAARAGAKPIADEAKLQTKSHEVREGIIVRSRHETGRIEVLITVKPGWPMSLGIWEEYGTDPHFISVDDSQRAGLSVRKVNEKVKDGSLVIGGQFVGATVWHPGAGPHPFLRPALDLKEGEAVAAAQTYINSRISRAGVIGTSAAEEGDA